MATYNQKKKNRQKLFLVCIFVFLFFFSAPSGARAEGASFRLSEPKGTGERFSIDALVDSKDEALNAAQAVIRFSPEKMQVSEVSINGSIFQLWFQTPVFSNSEGKIFFGGGLPNPGFTGKGGRLFTIVFTGKDAGKAEIYFEEEIATANSPAGENIFSSSRGEMYSVSPAGKISQEIFPDSPPLAPSVRSSSHPQQDQWYNDNNPEFKWDIAPDISEVAIAFNQAQFFEPDLISKEAFDLKRFEGVEDGVWYFHIKFKNDIGWGETAHFKIQVDTRPPKVPEILIDNRGDLTNPKPSLYLRTEDELSGISYFKIIINEKTFFASMEETNPFQLPFSITPGDHAFRVEAVDRARNIAQGNSEIKVEPIERPQITVCPSLFAVGEEIIYLGGSALPDSEVKVFLEKDGKLIKEWNESADQSGYWSLAKKDLLPPGNYKISAKTIDSRGAESNFSEPCFTGIVLSGFSIGPLIIVYKSIAFFGVILFLALLVGVFYLSRKFKKTRESIGQEIEDLRHKFYKEYQELKRGLEKELEFTKAARGGRETSPEERKREKELLKDLSDVKEVLEKELKDIEAINKDKTEIRF